MERATIRRRLAPAALLSVFLVPSTLAAMKPARVEAENGPPAARRGAKPKAPDAPAMIGESARWNEEGIRRARARHFSEAIDAFRRAVDADSKQPIPWTNLGSVHLTLGRYGSAERAFRRAIAIDANYGLAWYDLGAALDAQGDYEGAVNAYARAFELDRALMDVAANPPVVNNRRLAAVQITLYQRQAGALGAALISTRDAAPPTPAR